MPLFIWGFPSLFKEPKVIEQLAVLLFHGRVCVISFTVKQIEGLEWISSVAFAWPKSCLSSEASHHWVTRQQKTLSMAKSTIWYIGKLRDTKRTGRPPKSTIDNWWQKSSFPGKEKLSIVYQIRNTLQEGGVSLVDFDRISLLVDFCL